MVSQPDAARGRRPPARAVQAPPRVRGRARGISPSLPGDSTGRKSVDFTPQFSVIPVLAGPNPPMKMRLRRGGALNVEDSTVEQANAKSRAFIGVMIALGMSVLITGLSGWQSQNPARFYVYLLLALLAAGLKVNVPQAAGSISGIFIFVLIGVAEMTVQEAMVLACASTWVHAALHGRDSRVRAPVLFHVANAAVAVSICSAVYHSAWAKHQDLNALLTLALAATVLYALNTFPVAAVMTLGQGRRLAGAWQECNFWAFPFYLAGAAFAAVMQWINRSFGWEASLLLLPIVFVAYSGFHFYLGRLSNQRTHLERMAALHLRTIEALALAIEAKDQTGPMHLPRLQFHSVALGKELGMNPEDLEALRAAALLHDIGKLAVPEHILSKPGRLTREEFEKIKIHPVVGAEILERVNFPYAVAPMVRFHHEQWNGGGYPAGIKGEAIPLGARILAVVDCLDALISDRPYRKAIPMAEAVDRIAAESGVSFDPRVVRILCRRYRELEARLADSVRAAESASAPSAAGDSPRPLPPSSISGSGEGDFLSSIAAARREAQDLLALTQELGNSLHLDETLSMLAARLKRIVAFDCLVIYVAIEGRLHARYASGQAMSLFLARQIPFGHALSGWVAQNRRPILNGDVALELGGGEEGARPPNLNSALAVPLTGVQDLTGVLLLCRAEPDAFTRDDLRILEAVGAKLGAVIENALKYEQAAASASTDFLTGLPNARALQLQLEGELARCRRMGGALAILVCDLDGFKQVNDRFGHLEGNNVLRAVGGALRDSVREYDYVARIGGDEFVVLMPGMNTEDAALKAGDLRRACEQASREAVPGSSVSLSVGQARFPDDGGDPEQLLATADQRMYQGKEQRKTLTRARPRGFDFDSTGAVVQ
jgi:diguanylate cyclase (GGDEF)-like protein/putative nucleotidyltransferase with HDIG domain